MKKVRTLKKQRHPNGNIPKGAVYTLNTTTGFYEYRKDGKVISSVNESGVRHFNHIFEPL